MNDKAFFDTNILVYAFDAKEVEKSRVAKDLIRHHGGVGNLVISTQVLQEFYASVSRMGKKLMSKEDAEYVVNDLSEFPLIQIDKTLIAHAMKRHQSNKFSFWDSLIVEAALQSGCSTLFSEDMQQGRTIDELTICDPFKTE